jgi:Fe-S cluster biogenesis protein NfuA
MHRIFSQTQSTRNRLVFEQIMSETSSPDIARIINEDVRPWIEIDGGRIEFVRYEDEIVYVRLGGACRGCPATALTLKAGVERRIREKVPEVRGVEMVHEENDSQPDVDLTSLTL